MSEQEAGEREAIAAGRLCPACGKPTAPSDRFCAECGTRLETEDGGREAEERILPSSVLRPPSSSDSKTWLFAAKPATVVGSGLLLLVLAVVLLFAGQRDDTGTIVMLAICLTPLALITLAIGLARAVVGQAGGGRRA